MKPVRLVDEDERDPIDLLAERYAELCRRGHAPTVDAFTAGHPDQADALRSLLPAVAFLERSKFISRSGSAVPLAGVAPDRLGENRIVGELGRGGMGIVYEAVQEPLGRRVAVKILHRHALMDPKGRQRFLREARAVARMQHPNIVPIFGVGEHEEIPYYVMGLVEGTGLDRVLAAEGVGIAERSSFEIRARAKWVARLGLQGAEALAYAHDLGVLHRDIKPANLLLDDRGTLWLADFGLAKLGGDLSLTGTSELPGTLRYLAPECLAGDGNEQSDVYSLGLTLYELLLGHPAFDETDRVRLLRQVQESRPTAPRALLPAIPRDLETIVLKAIAREPADRYLSADAVVQDLRLFLDDLPIQARRPSLGERSVRVVRRNPLPATLAATTLLFGLIAAYFLRLYIMAPPPPRPGDREPPRRQGPGRGQPDFGPDRPPPPPFGGRPNGPPPRRFFPPPPHMHRPE
ncbi:MAG: serine/threonine protein kinase [Planctomycetota bacterium]|nr:serine/threonine protein kinase [Planctomycetota bacterium]